MTGLLIIYIAPTEQECADANVMGAPAPEYKTDTVAYYFDPAAVTGLFMHPDGTMVIYIAGVGHDFVYNAAIFADLKIMLADK